MSGSGRVALIAGAGDMPRAVVKRLPQDPVIVALEGFPPEGLAPDRTFRLETLGAMLEALEAQGVDTLCLAGRVSRPPVDPARIDAQTKPLIPALMAAMAEGDDGALRGLIAVLEGQGFDVKGVHDLAPDLLPPMGVAVGEVNEQHQRDAARGEVIVAAMGAGDVGQACVVADGQALAVEALPGTDWMLRSLTREVVGNESLLSDPLGVAADWLSGPAMPVTRRERDPSLPSGGLLFKGPKPGQELRVDMPTIGPETIRNAAECGLEGVVIEAGGVLALDWEACSTIAREAGLFLWVRERGAA